MFESIDEYVAEIVIINKTIQRLMKIGQSSTVQTVGNSRSNTEMTLSDALAYKKLLLREKGILDTPAKIIAIKVGW